MIQSFLRVPGGGEQFIDKRLAKVEISCPPSLGVQKVRLTFEDGSWLSVGQAGMIPPNGERRTGLVALFEVCSS